MKLKKFEADTEQKAIELVKDELGMDALILNIKKIKPRGFLSFLKKEYVEITAAYEDKQLIKVKESFKDKFNEAEKKSEEIQKRNIEDSKKIAEQAKTISELQKKLSSTEYMLENAMKQLSSVSLETEEENRIFKNKAVKVLYDNLINQGVSENVAEYLFEDIEDIEDIDKLNVNLIVKIVYNKIMKVLGKPKIITKSDSEKFAQNIVFIGPTGVGKTTTIAKLSSHFILDQGLSVSFITADTYRIAAVEQLKTYAEILNSDVGIVYNPDDVVEQIDNMKVINDFIFIDTAGRSHKNGANVDELKVFLDKIPNPEIFLVLSLTTKYDDLLKIISAYDEITNFKIIFTKLDETACLGSILNICYATGKEISYLTNGQNVPDDFEIIKPEKIAKILLGSMYK